jgi:hypothetical protein
MNWEIKLVYYATNVHLSDYSGCCSTISNNEFLTILIISDATLLSSCGIDFFFTLISNNFDHRYLVGVKNPCIDCKDYVPILIGFCLGMRVFDHD